MCRDAPAISPEPKKIIFEDHDKMYDDLDYDALDSILEHTRASTKEKENSLVIIDDFGAL